MYKKMFSTLFILIQFLSLFSQDLNQKIDKENLIKDFDLLKSTLKSLHPGLYNYHSKEEFENLFHEYENRLDRDLNSMGFYHEIGSLIKEIGDAHTEIEPSEIFYDSLNEHWRVFPISTKWLNRKLYVIRDFSDEQLTAPKDQIISINGVAAEEVFYKLREYIPRDGKNLTSPNHALSGTFSQFRNCYAAIYGTPNSFQLEILKANGTKEGINIKGLKYKTIFGKYENEKSKTKSNPPLSFEIKNQVAILKITSFHPGEIKDAKQKFKKFFKRSFKTITKSNVDNLIIDIQGNGGGHQSVFIELLKYLLDEPFIIYQQLSTITNTIPNAEYFLEKRQIAQLEKWGAKNLKKKGDIFISNDIGTTITKPKNKNFKGKVFILIDGKSASASGDFSGIIKAHKRAIFIGEETGGNPYVNSGGTRLTLVLPHSQLQIIIPTLFYKMNYKVENDGHGVQPDYPIELSIDDFISKKDKALEFALSLIKGKR